MIPPRPKPREPFLLAADFASGTGTPPEPTMRCLGAKLDELAGHVRTVHSEAALARQAAERAETNAARVGEQVGVLSKLVIGDHAQRITDVERRSTLPPGVKRGAVYTAVGGIGAALVPLLDWAIPLVQKWIETR